MGPGSSPRVVQVEIDQGELQKKPYLGGFRHKKTGATYHHAFTQTPRKPKYSEADRKLSRETQTYDTKSLRVQTTREQGTQMRRPGVLLDESGDYILVPGPYMTAEELLRIKDRKAVIIQCALRGWLARRRANELKRQNIERESFLKEEEEARAEEESAKRRYEIERRMHPRTAADFEILYNELEAWRLQETNKIKNSELDAETQHEALRQLLSKETKLLQTIDRLKSAANSENKALRIAKTLKDMSAPKKWDLSNGRMVQVHTPFTTRSKELAQLYNGLNLPNLTVDERLDVLLHVKWTVKEFDCNLTREIVELIDREADLLNRGRSPTIMDGLRRRISSLFLAFIETPEFNPEAGRFQIVPLDFDGYQQVPMDGQIPRSFGAAS
uniref:Iq and ubiquitin-like domain-containing n=1 Tax=Tetraselmis sp. GSL018 TaxID=582737 RepID=A0A061RZE0_9CHLO